MLYSRLFPRFWRNSLLIPGTAWLVELGFTAILHTWDQKLLDHFHLHCLVAGGALSFDGNCFIRARKDYLFPVRALSKVFRGKFVDSLKKMFAKSKLIFPGNITYMGTEVDKVIRDALPNCRCF
jgi:hypothetical protein